jgi:hypothetical protein
VGPRESWVILSLILADVPPLSNLFPKYAASCLLALVRSNLPARFQLLRLLGLWPVWRWYVLNWQVFRGVEVTNGLLEKFGRNQGNPVRCSGPFLAGNTDRPGSRSYSPRGIPVRVNVNIQAVFLLLVTKIVGPNTLLIAQNACAVKLAPSRPTSCSEANLPCCGARPYVFRP